MTDAFDVDLHDSELDDEIALTAALMVAASESSAPLTLAEIDELLGVVAPVIPQQPGAHPTEQIAAPDAD